MACAQKDTSRPVSHTGMPTRALNHWRSASTSVTSTIGMSNSAAANCAILSKRSSGGVSRIKSSYSAARRAASLSGVAAMCIVEPAGRSSIGMAAI